MPLADLQAALGTFVAAQACNPALTSMPSLQSLTLTHEETAWLESLPSTPGFRVTCAIQRWWRETRLRDMARLTIAALGREQSAQLIARHLQANLCTSLFFLPETLGFLRFVEHTTNHPHLSAIAQFERALLLAKEEASQPPSNDSPQKTIIEFAAPPIELFSAILRGQTLPDPSQERFPVLVSSSLPHYWCEATYEEPYMMSQPA